jgi:hypothetical protein
VWGRGDQSPEFSKASIDAVCIINNLAKHQVSRKALVNAGFLEGLIRLLSFSENTIVSLSGLEKGEVILPPCAPHMMAPHVPMLLTNLGRCAWDSFLDVFPPFSLREQDEVVFVASAMAAARLCPQERIKELVIAPAEINAMVLSLQHALAQVSYSSPLLSFSPALSSLLPLFSPSSIPSILLSCPPSLPTCLLSCLPCPAGICCLRGSRCRKLLYRGIFP